MNLKVNLKISGPNINNFLNIDPLSNPNDPNCVAANFDNIDALVDHNSCSQLLALDVLDYLPLQMRAQVLNNWACKISHGGTIIVGGLDIREAARAIYYQNLDILREGNLMLFGPADHIMRLKKSLVTIDDTVNMIMQTNQFSIISKKFDGLNYLVEARRN